MAPPREIAGSPGSRIRLIFGGDGSSWLLLVDGTTKQQQRYWNSIPDKVEKQLGNCSKKGRDVRMIDFGGSDSNSWFIKGQKPDGSGGHSWWDISAFDDDKTVRDYVCGSLPVQVSLGSNDHSDSCVMIQGSNGHFHSNIDGDLLKRIKRIHGRKKAIKFIRLFDYDGGGYFICDDEGTEWKNVGQHCSDELKKANNRNVNDVAVAGDGSWVIITPFSFQSSNGVDKALIQHLNRFYREQRELKNRRDREIQAYHERVAREAREAEERARAEREAAERAERVRRESEERERAEREERERAEREERERAELEERNRIQREDEERAERQAQASRAAALESMLEEHLLQEALDIREQELSISEQQAKIRVQEQRLQNRKVALRRSMDQMSEALRDRIGQNLDSPDRCSTPSTTTDLSSAGQECVVCHDNPAVRATIPCGHHCLCDSCADVLMSQPPTDRNCPLCRSSLQSSLRIFSSS